MRATSVRKFDRVESPFSSHPHLNPRENAASSWQAGMVEIEFLANVERAAIEGFGNAGVAKLVDARDLSARDVND